MNLNCKIYKRGNYTIQKCINIDCTLYEKLKKIANYEYDTNISVLVNIGIENLLEENNIIYYPKPKEEISEYRSLMIRKDNVERLNQINRETGISVTRLINLAIKRFVEFQEKLE